MLSLWLAATSALAQPYGVYREVWTGIDGGAVSDLTNNPAFPNSPSLTNVLTDYFDAPHDWADLYGTRLRAFLLPPASGNYTFWVASDDNSVLFLSTDETPANKMQIAYVATWTGWREWTKEANQKSGPVYLEGGRRYYLEALQKEGGGSDNISVGWQLPSGSQELPIPATRGFPFTGVASARPAVVSQPTNLTVMDGRSATFSVLVSDPVPVSYSWQQAGAAIPGATNSLLTLPAVFTNQTGTQFRCVISNSVGALTSALATLTVLRDTNPPTLSSVANLGFNVVRILFSKPLEPASATNRFNYSLSGGVTISNATLASDGQSVLLTVSPLPYNVAYTQTVSNVRDASTAHNVIAPNSRFVFTTSLPGIYREVFYGVTGSTVPDLTNNLNYPTNPSVAYLVTDYVEAVNIGTDYGQRYRGLLIPPATGSYVFWVASDDASTLYLSSDESPVNMVPIASVNSWTSYRTWTTEANQQSAPIMLTAGRRYYLEALHKQGGGGDNFTVRWQLPDGTMEEPMPASRLNPVGLLPPQILAQPTNLTVVEGASPVLAVLVGNRDVMSYQWQKNGANIPNATNAVFTNWFVPITDNGARFRCVLTNVLAVTNSAEALLAVTPDVTPPTIVSAQNVGTTNLQIVFSERVEAATATNAANYAFGNSVPVLAAVFGPDAKTILLTTGPLVFGINYTLIVNHVR
ncbi:MAG: PA14 domain-containing protein, partial [Verrucomicrobia bacterium]|nr:PA14 domain-containing protein [Verrucomicrobiota bacterium]